MPPTRRPQLRPSIALCLTAVAITTLAACGGSNTSDKSNSTHRGGTLTIGAGVTPNLDPAQVAPPYFWPIYDTPIHETADGKFVPDLATSWGYAGSGNTAFQFKLRQGAKFADGSALTAAAAVASMKRFLAAPGPVAVSAGPVHDVEAQGSDTVIIRYKQPVPYTFAVGSLTQNHSFGALVGPNGLQNAKSLGTTPDGVGQYKLDSAGTTPGSLYTYVANPSYFNQQAVHYNKIVIRTIPSAASMLSSAQAGQIDYATSIAANSMSAAKSSGLNVLKQDYASSTTMTILNQTSGPLANLQVRQAIEYAIPRNEIINAVLGGRGQATSSVGVPTLLGYNPDDVHMYDYNIEKAKSLLTQAGHADGFSVTAITQPNFSTLAQALAASLEKVGIHVNLTVNSGTFPQYVSALQSKKYDLAVATEPSLDIYSFVDFTLSPGGTNNPFNLPTTDLTSAIAAAAALPTQKQAAAFAEVTNMLDRKAWVVPIALGPSIYSVSKKVQNVPTSFVPSLFYPDPFSPVASGGWYGS